MTREQKFQDFSDWRVSKVQGTAENIYDCLSFFIIGSQRKWGPIASRLRSRNWYDPI